MAVRGSELRLSFSAKNPISSPIPLRSLWEPRGPLGWNSQQKEALLYLFICPRQFALLCMNPPSLSSSVFSRCVCALGSPQRHAFHWHTPSCHKNARRLNKEHVCSERFRIPVPPVEPQRPREEAGEWLESNTSCKELKNCQKERNYGYYTTAGIQMIGGVWRPKKEVWD